VVRIDRLLTLVAAKFTKNSAGGAAILMYHDVSDTPEAHLHPYYRITTTPERFAEQMAFLKIEGYRSCTPGELFNMVQKGTHDKEKLIAITFDDGFESVYQHAFPVLKKHGFSAMVYLPSALISDDRVCFQEKPLMIWSEVAEMAQAGIAFGSHTTTHPELITLAQQDVAEQIEKSKITIENKLGKSVTSFAFPFAYPETNKTFSSFCREVLIKAGYADAVTTIVGTVSAKDDLLALKRLPVNSDDDIQLLKAKLYGGYNWVRMLQVLIKKVKAKRSKTISIDFR